MFTTLESVAVGGVVAGKGVIEVAGLSVASVAAGEGREGGGASAADLSSGTASTGQLPSLSVSSV